MLTAFLVVPWLLALGGLVLEWRRLLELRKGATGRMRQGFCIAHGAIDGRSSDFVSGSGRSAHAEFMCVDVSTAWCRPILGRGGIAPAPIVVLRREDRRVRYEARWGLGAFLWLGGMVVFASIAICASLWRAAGSPAVVAALLLALFAILAIPAVEARRLKRKIGPFVHEVLLAVAMSGRGDR